MLGRIAGITLFVGCAVSAAPALAAPIIFSGTGTVESVGGRLAPTGLTPVGSSLTFSFTFDPSAAVFYEADDFDSVYDLPVTNFYGSIGSYALSLTADPTFSPALLIGKGFSFFGETSSEPSLSYTIYLSAPIAKSSDPQAPFALPAGGRSTFSVTATKRVDVGETVPGIDQLFDPASADQLTFQYSSLNPATRAGGSLYGSFVGGFAGVGAVPEPATWVMMIFGFGAVGRAMRRRRALTPQAA